MGKPLRVLIVEDAEEDALLLLHELRHAGYEPVYERVDTLESMEKALRGKEWDIVISDYMMPRFNGLAALEVLKESRIDLPFIIMSGRIGEEVAVQAMKAGAHDYIVKGNSARLIPAIERALGDAETRRERRKAENELEQYRNHLEDLVRERTAELKVINEHLRLEMTERNKAEEDLKRHRDHLEEIVAERTVDLININERLQDEVSERMRVEQGLRESDNKFRKLSQEFHTLLNSIPDSLILLSPDLKILWANQGAADALEADVTGLPGRRCHEVWYGRSVPCEVCHVRKSFSTGKEEAARIVTPDGRFWETRAIPIKDENGNVSNVIEIASDITQRMSMEADSIRTAHLVSLGELAAGVAHEINNPINGIINYAQILSDRSAAGGKEHEIAGRIIKEGDRIANIVKSLLTFARERKEEKRPARVYEILTDALALTEVKMQKSGIDFKIDIPPDLPEIVVNHQQIQQVFLNIINNAQYALNEKTAGKDRTKALEISGKAITVDGCRYVRVSFRDSGSGISGDIIDKIMAPFFTTKPSGHGTGLGLSISHGIIRGHGGRITIESVENEYTNVIIDLPVNPGDEL